MVARTLKGSRPLNSIAQDSLSASLKLVQSQAMERKIQSYLSYNLGLADLLVVLAHGSRPVRSVGVKVS